MVMAATQIAITVQQTGFSSAYVDNIFGDMLKVVAVNAAKALDPDINNITNQQLVELSKEIGVTHISLMVRTNDDIVVARSSSQDEIGLSTKNWGIGIRLFWNCSSMVKSSQLPRASAPIILVGTV